MTAKSRNWNEAELSVEGGGGRGKSPNPHHSLDPPSPNAEIFFPVKDEISDSAGEYDLFGNPLEPIRDRRGRPSFSKSKENQDFVAVRAANGWSHARIAQALGCDDDTLRKHFSGELRDGRLIIEGLILDVTLRKIREGHTPSIRLMQDRFKESAPAAPRGPAVKDETLGKKEQRLLDAAKVPDEWGDIDAGRKQ